MKKIALFCIVLLIAGSGLALFSQDYREYANRQGKLSLGIDATVPTALILPELTEFLAGPTIHFGLTDTIELKASLEPLVRVSWFLTQLVQESSEEVGFAAVGALDLGARFYFSPYRESWFAEADFVSVFGAAGYDFLENKDQFMFMALPLGLGTSLGYDFGNFSIEGGAYLIAPELIATSFGEMLEGLGDIQFIPFPKFSVTWML